MTAALPAATPCPHCQSGVNTSLTPKPRKRARRTVENADYISMVRRVVRRLRERVGRDGDIESLIELAALRPELDDAIYDSVTLLRGEHGFSWAEVGRVLQISRQAAQQKYGRGVS